MARTYGFLSTYPPTQCGLATFTASLLRHLTAVTPGSTGRVVRVLTEPVAITGTSMVHQMTPGAVDEAAEVLNRCDLVVLPTATERDGYVPNVVYSCGALLHDDTLVIPYGASDASIGLATTSLRGLLAALTGKGQPQHALPHAGGLP